MSAPHELLLEQRKEGLKEFKQHKGAAWSEAGDV